MINEAHAQITINSTSPCFYNYTAPQDMLKNCGITNDWLQTFMMPWQWVSGGYFSLILVSVFVTFSYLKYRKAVYPMLAGLMFLPLAWFLFPTEFMNFALGMMVIAVGLLLIWALIRQTKEYDG